MSMTKEAPLVDADKYVDMVKVRLELFLTEWMISYEEEDWHCILLEKFLGWAGFEPRPKQFDANSLCTELYKHTKG